MQIQLAWKDKHAQSCHLTLTIRVYAYQPNQLNIQRRTVNQIYVDLVAFMVKLKECADMVQLPSKCGSSVITPEVVSPDYKAFKQLGNNHVLHLSADCQSADKSLKAESYAIVSYIQVAMFCCNMSHL